jgi:tRNA threonylcarbamoyl adenosine modification protein (Sua5/YciO/YrdC/YwlC family)
MAQYFRVHPRDPQPRVVGQVAALLRDGALVAYPTDSCYALGCSLDHPAGADRIRRIRALDGRHHFTLVCAEFAQLGQFVILGNPAFRAVKAATPGPYTFILPATRDVPRRLAHPRKRTVGVRIPDHPFVRALLRELGQPLVSSTLLLPGEGEPLTNGRQVQDRLAHEVDAVVDAGDCSTVPTTVVDWTGEAPVVARYGAGDPSRFA